MSTRPAWLNPPYEGTAVSLGGFVTLTNVGAAYDSTNAAKGLGLALIDFTNVGRIDWGVFVNKVGTGTQDWQLWNVTDGAQLGVISDAGATGDKLLTGVITSGLPTGLKTVRVRVKSSVGADDPLYFGSYLTVS
jgi:hypothetical protein